MRFMMFIGSIALMLSGCANLASSPEVQNKIRMINQTVPTCTTDKECEVKWSAARQWILANSGYKLQHVQPDFMETYNPTNASVALAVRVVKEVRQEGGSRIVATVWCDNIFGCQPDMYDALLNFNNKVNSAWKQ